MMDTEGAPAPQDLSRRAARRLIQRATVLMSRDRHVRQNIREARLSMLWVLEDWGLEWTVLLDRGKIAYDRRPVKRPDVRLTWPEAAGFFESATAGRESKEGFSVEGNPEFRRYADLLWKSLSKALGEVLRFPFDDEGVRLA